MRILQVHSGNLYGGVETMLSALCEAGNAASGLEVEFALCFRGRFQAEMEGKKVPVHDLGTVRVRNPLSILRAQRKLGQVLSKGRYDAVVCQAAWTLAIFGPTIRRSGLPLVLWLHDPPGASLHWLERWSQRCRPALVLCNSQYTQALGKRLFKDVPSRVLYCPVNWPHSQLAERERRELRGKFGADAGDCVILQVGRLERHKGHLVHLEALAQLPRSSRWMFWCVSGVQKPSEQAYFQEIRRKIADAGLSERVRLIGWQPSLQNLYRSADVYCQPNVRPEPFGIAFIEAMYACLPLVGTAQGGTVEVITPEVGALVPPSDPAALAAALSVLVENPERRRSLGARGPERAKDLCDPRNQNRKFRGIMGDLLTPAAG